MIEDEPILDNENNPQPATLEVKITRVLIVLTTACIVVSVGIMISRLFAVVELYMLSYILGIAGQIGLVGLMIWHGTLFERSWYKWPLIIALGVLLIGMALMIMHLPGKMGVMLVAAAAVGTIYFFHFFAKPEKRVLDYLKLSYIAIGVGMVLTTAIGVRVAIFTAPAFVIFQLSMFGLFAVDYFKEH